MGTSSSINTRAALEFLQTSGLVNLNTPLEQLVTATTTIGDVAGYVLAWDKYVLVVPTATTREECPPQ